MTRGVTSCNFPVPVIPICDHSHSVKLGLSQKGLLQMQAGAINAGVFTLGDGLGSMYPTPTLHGGIMFPR